MRVFGVSAPRTDSETGRSGDRRRRGVGVRRDRFGRPGQRGVGRLSLGGVQRANLAAGQPAAGRDDHRAGERIDGHRAGGSSYVGFTPAIGSLCIPAMNLEDGPAGVGDGMANVTQLPAPVDVASTWDTSAEQLYGQVIGSEQAAKGTTVDLGPTINIVRDPRWGRGERGPAPFPVTHRA